MPSQQPSGLETIEHKVALLKEPRTYPERPSRIDVVETHMSWVFLTEHHAYKLKKPVRYDFLDFSTLAARHQNCLEELRLNRRLARNVYLGVIALTANSQGNARLGGDGKIIDWLVKMRRLPAERLLDSMIKQHTVQAADVDALARVLTAFYQRCVPIEISGQQYRAQLEQDIRSNLRELTAPSYGLSSALVERITQVQLTLLEQQPQLFDERAKQGRIIEGHGDLRPEHICLEREPVIFDCLEFNRRFRIIDAADELAFLSLECERLSAPFIGSQIFEIYTQMTGDSPARCLLEFYKAYRACLRAKLAIWHTRELPLSAWPKWRALANDYLRLASR